MLQSGQQHRENLHFKLLRKNLLSPRRRDNNPFKLQIPKKAFFTNRKATRKQSKPSI